MKAIFTLYILFLFHFITFGQENWREMMHDPDANFFEIQKKFYEEFGTEPGEKGSGWKQFKRWEYYYQFRVDENGNFPPSGSILDEMTNYWSNNALTRYSTGTGTWTELGPIAKPNNGTGQPNGNGRLTCITFHPTDANTLYVGAPGGGFWKSTDGGTTWAKSISGLIRLGISSIVIDPTNPDIIYIATGDRDAGDSPGYGVWKSTDGGATWASSNTGMGDRTVNEILMDPTDETHLIASTSGSRIYSSSDAGASWTFTSLSSSAKDIAFKPGDPSVVYAAGTTFERSTDGGASFTQITSGVPSGSSRIAIAVSANSPNTVYLLSGDGTGLVGLYRSTDSGLNFSTRSTTPNILGYDVTGGSGSQAWYDLVLASDPTDANTIFAGGINIWKSTDGGANWTISSHWVGSGGIDDVHADQHALEFSPHSNNLYAGHDGGIHITTDDGVVWNELSSGLGIAQVYKIGVSQEEGVAEVINGYQDNGTAIYNNGAWNTEIGGDGMECIIDPTDPTFMYGALYYGDVRRSINGGNTFSAIADNGLNGINEVGAWVTPYKLDPNNPARMFVGYDNVWRSNDVKSPAANAITWTRISSFSGTNNMTDIAIAPSNSSVVYASRQGSSTFYKSTNALSGSPSWTDLTANLPISSTPKDIEIDPTDEDHLFIALNNDIYESTNGGTSWSNFSGTLPNISLNTIVIDPSSNVQAMYVGMDVGVYYRDNSMGDWLSYSNGLSNVEITELEIHNQPTTCTSLLYAATYGQGMWASDLKDPGNLAPRACFKTSATNVCLGSPITFTDETDFSPTSWAWTVTPNTVSYVNSTNANSQNPEVSFLAAGTYTVELNTDNANGADVESKTNYITVTNSTIAPSFSDDMESHALCGTASDCGTTVCNLSGSFWTNLSNGTEDDIDFRIDAGGTPSTGTGPTVDANPGTASGNYLYTEASSCSGAIAIMESGCVNLDQNYTFNMQYYMEGADMGSLHLDLNVEGEWTEDIIPAISGDQGNSWQPMTIDLSSYTGKPVKLRVRSITGNGFRSDIAIDDMTFDAIIPMSAELLQFDAQANAEQQVNLFWETAREFRGSRFEVERSVDGINWSTIHVEKALDYSDVALQYEAQDKEPANGTGYYRLKAVSNDQFSYSPLRTVNIVSESQVELFPNPTNEYIVVSMAGIKDQDVSIYSSLGQKILVKTQSVNDHQLKIAVDHFPEGIYFARITNEEQGFQILKFVVKR